MGGSVMATEKPNPRGELRRRWRAFMQDGSIGRLRSEGRLMALYFFCWADFEKCTAKFAIRGAARTLGVRPMTAQRGVQQLLEAGILTMVLRGEGSADSIFGLGDPTTGGGRPDHGWLAQRLRAVCAPTTSGGRSAYEPWAPYKISHWYPNRYQWGNQYFQNARHGRDLPARPGGGGVNMSHAINARDLATHCRSRARLDTTDNMTAILLLIAAKVIDNQADRLMTVARKLELAECCGEKGGAA